MSSVEDVLREAGIGPSRIHRMFSRAERDLDAEKQIAESRSGRKLADLNLYYDIAVPSSVSIEALCDALNALPSVELAAPAPLPQQAPSDMAPTTPDYQAEQGYRLAAPHGVGVSQVTAVAGAGALESRSPTSSTSGFSITKTSSSRPLRTSTPRPLRSLSRGRGQPWHRSARDAGRPPQRLRRDGSGAEATLRVAPAMTVSHGYNVARAINLAAQTLAAR
jgi:hypothetical protein